MEQLQHYLESVNRELDQRHDDIRAHRLVLNKLQEDNGRHITWGKIGLVVLGLLQAGNLALIAHLFKRIEEVSQLLNKLL